MIDQFTRYWCCLFVVCLGGIFVAPDISAAQRLNGLLLEQYNYIGTGFVDNHAEFESAFTSVSVSDMFHSAIVETIDGGGSTRNNFLSEFSGYIHIPSTGDYSFAIDGDDAIELLIDDVVVAAWYGGHARCGCVNHNATVTLTEGDHTLKFRHHENTGSEYWHLYWKQPSDSTFAIVPNSSLSYDAPSPPSHEWRMDACQWIDGVDDVVDSAGNNDGRALNGATLAGGKICKAAFFDGIDDYIALPNFPNLENSFTLTAWFNTASNGERGQRIFADDENNTAGYAISVGDGGSGKVRFYDRSQPSAGIIDTQAIIENNIWYFVVAVVDMDNSIRHLYVFSADGLLLDHKSLPITNARGVDSGVASIGGETDGGETSNRFDGYIDEVSLYDYALNIQSIRMVQLRQIQGKNPDGSTRSCSVCCDNFAQGLNYSTYDMSSYGNQQIDNHGEFVQVISTYANEAFLDGTTVVDNINVLGSNNNPFSADSDEHYLTLFDGYISVDTLGEYTFAVNGDDAVEVLVDGRVVSSWYGGHGRSYSPTTSGSVTRIPIILQPGFHQLEFHHHENTGQDNYELHWTVDGGPWTIVPPEVLYHCAPVVGEWRFDSCDFTDKIAEDSSSNNFHGEVVGGLPSVVGKVCRAGQFDGTSSYVVIDDEDKFDDTDQLTLSMWFNVEQRVHDGGTNARGLISKRKTASNNESFGVFFWNNHGKNLWIDIDGTNDRFKTNTEFEENRWYHLAVVFDGRLPAEQRVSVYVDGILDSAHAESSAAIPGYESNLYVGNLYYGPNELKLFKGMIDEVRIADSALSPSAIYHLMNIRRYCGCSTIDHFVLTHDGYGLTCAPETVMVKACADAACTSTYSGDVTLSFSPTDTHSHWVDGSPQSVVFNGSAEKFSLYHTTASDVTLGLTSNPEAQNDPVFVNTSGGGSDVIQFKDTGFIIDISAGRSCTKLDGTIRAVVKDTNTGACVAAHNFAGQNKDVDLWFNYVEPASGTRVPQVNKTGLVVDEGGSSFSLKFDSKAQASFDVRYNDAGSLNFYARHKGVDVTSGLDMQGSTSAAVVFVPDHFALQAINPATVTPPSAVEFLTNNSDSGNTIYAAGKHFNFTTRAVCAYGSTTPNFRALTSLTVDDYEPSAGSKGSFAPEQFISSAYIDGMAQTTQANYTEVGWFNLNAKHENYLASGLAVEGSIGIGRFVPDHFKVSILQPGVFAPFCDDFTYIGQSFGYEVGFVPELLIEAQNVYDLTTKNYRDNFMKLSSAQIVIVPPVADNTQLGVDSGTPLLRLAWASAERTLTANNDGTLNFTLSDTDTYRYSRESNALVAPFNTDISLVVSRIVDSDGVTAPGSPVAVLVPDSIKQRYGRMRLDNAHGSEMLDLPMLMQAEYWNGSAFSLNTFDSCSSFVPTTLVLSNTIESAANPIRVKGNVTTTATVTHNPSSSTLSSGDGNLQFSAPGSGGDGWVDVELTVPPYLQFNWNGSGDENPTSRATFGIYQGNKRIIYIRETTWR